MKTKLGNRIVKIEEKQWEKIDKIKEPIDRLRAMEKMADSGLVGYSRSEFDPRVLESIEYTGYVALKLMGYHKYRKNAGLERKCERCEVLMPLTGRTYSKCEHCRQRKQQPKYKTCTLCNCKLSKNHRYKTFGSYCCDCSSDCGLVTITNPDRRITRDECGRRIAGRIRNELATYVQTP